jgi:hypothetical protein
MNKNLKDQDVLLVKEKKSDEVKVVKGIENGKLETVKPTSENQPNFMKIDRHGNVMDNFLSNFVRQFKDPTQFLFFKVPADQAGEASKNLQAALKNPNTSENKVFLDTHKVDLPAQNEYKIKFELVDWGKFEKYGITREGLEKSGNLDKLLNYNKTNLMPVTMKFDEETLRSDARFSLRKQEDGRYVPNVHLIRKEPELERPYFGIKFTEEDKQNLLSTGNLGRAVEAEFKQGEKIAVYLSLDKQTNELVACRFTNVVVPEKYKGVMLNEEQRQGLSRGEKVEVKGMISTKGKSFDGEVQFNADKRYFELIFNNGAKQSWSQNQGNRQSETDGVRIPKTLLGVALSEKQQTGLKAGQTVYVSGMKDKAGQDFNAYVKVNFEKNKLDFAKYNPDRAQKHGAEITPDNRSKTQVAVNSEGKTNEATKNVKEPLDKGQTQPTEKQVEKQNQEQKPKKAKGIKM